jgi:threonine dehydrogenase-like Zn-dependent dehydrogenase
MRAVVFHGIGDIRVDEVDEPRIQDPTDAIVRITHTALCGTDLHLIRGTMPGVLPGTILGHEGVGVVEEIGSDVRNLRPGDRVVIPSTIGCGWCSYCRAGYYSQCDVANPTHQGTAFFGGPAEAGGFHGLQAEYARVPYANVGPVKLPESVTDEQAILLSDIFPTSWFGARLAEVRDGDTVAVFGAGIVGQLAMASAFIQGAGRVLAVDVHPDRLEQAKMQGAEAIDFEREDPVETIKRLTGGIGVDRVIDCVGVDAVRPHAGPATAEADEQAGEQQQVRRQVAPEQHPSNGNWEPGDAPGQALQWAVESLAKAGTLGIIGVYPQTMRSFPIGAAMMKNLTVKAGNCNHRRYLPKLIDLVQSGAIDPSVNLSVEAPFTDVLDAYATFDRREPGWVKVALTTGIADADRR